MEFGWGPGEIGEGVGQGRTARVSSCGRGELGTLTSFTPWEVALVGSLYVPVRLAAAVVAVAAAAGCMSVGDDEGRRAEPSHSAGQQGGEAPDGGVVVPGDGVGFGGGAAGGVPDGHGDGKDGRKKDGDGEEDEGEPGESGAPSASASALPGASVPAPVGPGRTVAPGGDPVPPKPLPTPTRTTEEPQPPEPSPEPPASPEPTVAEPSSSAHEQTGPQMVQREPAPQAGVPV